MAHKLCVRTVCLALLRTSYRKFEEVMNPWVKTQAKAKYGDRWLFECRSCLGFAMKEHADPDSNWDAYTLLSIMQSRLPCLSTL